MATYAAGSSYGAIYKHEDTFGTAPGTTPHWQTARILGGGPLLSKDMFESEELRTDRMISDLRHGNKKVGGDIPFEHSYGTQNDIIQAFLGGTYAVAYNLTSQTVTVVASTKKFSRASGSWITDGVAIGDYIVTTGFEAGGNNGTFLVSAVSALEITCATATGLVNVTDDTGVAVTTTKYKVKNGVTDRSLSWERQFSDITQYLLYVGCRVDTYSLSIKPGIIKGSFGLIGQTMTASGASADASPLAATTTSPFDSYTGNIYEGGSSIAYITGLEINGIKSMRGLQAVGDDKVVDVKPGRTKINGTVTAFFTDLTLLNKFINETETSIEVLLQDPSGNNSRYFFPRVKYSGGDPSVSGEGEITLTLPFSSLYSSTYAASMIHEYQPVYTP